MSDRSVSASVHKNPEVMFKIVSKLTNEEYNYLEMG